MHRRQNNAPLHAPPSRITPTPPSKDFDTHTQRRPYQFPYQPPTALSLVMKCMGLSCLACTFVFMLTAFRAYSYFSAAVAGGGSIDSDLGATIVNYLKDGEVVVVCRRRCCLVNLSLV